MHPLYSTYQAMMQRCYNPKRARFANYGGRGIRVCARWRDSFEAFCADAGDKPSPSHTLDRIDVNRDYSPDNCRWATRTEQAHNRTDTRPVTLFGETRSLPAWCAHLGVVASSAHARIRRGCTPEYAILAGLFSRRGRAEHAAAQNAR